MDINKIINIINTDDRIKRLIFELYIKDNLKELSCDNKVFSIYNEKLTFLNGVEFDYSSGNIDDLINIFESKIPSYKQIANIINDKINFNISNYITYLNSLIGTLKNKYFHLNDLNIYLTDKSQNDITLIVNINSNICKRIISIDKFWNYNQNFSDKNIISDIEGHIKEIILNKFKRLSKNTNYKFCYDKKCTQFIRIESNWYYNKCIYIPIDIIENKKLYNSIINEVKEYIDSEHRKNYMNNFNSKHIWKINNNLMENYNLDTGEINSNFDQNNTENKKILYNDILKKLDEYVAIKNAINEKEMYNFEFMGVIKIFKYSEQIIDGNKYSLYLHERKNKKTKRIFFKNGVKVGRSNYHKVAKLLGYVKTVKIYDEDSLNNWNKISKMQITEEQIEIYKDKLNWKSISRHHALSDNMLLKYHQYIDWSYILSHRKISKDVLEQLVPIIGWKIICRYSNRMNEKFLLNNLDNIDMIEIMKNPACGFISNVLNKLIESK